MFPRKNSYLELLCNGNVVKEISAEYVSSDILSKCSLTQLETPKNISLRCWLAAYLLFRASELIKVNLTVNVSKIRVRTGSVVLQLKQLMFYCLLSVKISFRGRFAPVNTLNRSAKRKPRCTPSQLVLTHPDVLALWCSSHRKNSRKKSSQSAQHVFFRFVVLQQELVKHTHDTADKSNLKIALDAMKVSVIYYKRERCVCPDQPVTIGVCVSVCVAQDLAQFVNEVKRDNETLREIDQYQRSIENLVNQSAFFFSLQPLWNVSGNSGRVQISVRMLLLFFHWLRLVSRVLPLVSARS